MPEFDPALFARATAVFKQGLKANSRGVHRTLNRAPRGKGWVPCHNAPEGMFCRPAKVRESLEYFRMAYQIVPDIAILNQLALGHEMLGELDEARTHFTRMREQAGREGNEAYRMSADMGLRRIGGSADGSGGGHEPSPGTPG
jgi:hypothetical protein